MDKALTANSPKLFVAAVRSVSTIKASDTIDINSRPSLDSKISKNKNSRASLCLKKHIKEDLQVKKTKRSFIKHTENRRQLNR